MKVLKTTSPQKQKLQQVEKLMDELGIVIENGGNNLIITIDDTVYRLIDLESPSFGITTSFPRTFEHERLAIMGD